MTAVRRWQIGLVALGVVLLGIAGVTLLNDVRPTRYLGIAAWLIGALVLHDGIAAMAVFGGSVLLRRVGKRIPFTVLAIVQGAVVIAVIVSAVVLPEIVKKGIGTANPSILPLDYLSNLVLVYAGIAAATAIAIAAYLLVRRTRKS